MRITLNDEQVLLINDFVINIMITLDSLIEDGKSIRAGIKFITTPKGVIRTYSEYSLSDTTIYGAWKAKVIRYLDKYFPGDRCISDFEKAISEFEKHYCRPSLFDVALGFIISCQEIGNCGETTTESKSTIQMTKKVFIVHGHDDEMKLNVARLLEQFKLEPIILSEQPDKGRTIIEKFEEESNVGFAVVLMSDKDDMGAAVGSSDYKPRARQNVILELGYFIGRLGRQNHVCVLKKGNVEVPSDILGIVYKAYNGDDEGWKLALAKELKAAGYQIDFNQIQ